MYSTLFLVGVLLTLLGLGVLLHAVALKVGLQLQHAENLTFRRIAFASIMMQLAGLVANLLTRLDPPIAVIAAVLLAAVVLQCRIVVRTFQTTGSKAFLAWLGTLVPGIPLLLLTVFVVKPHLAHVYQISSNSMAPTIVGRHLVGTCPKCGATTFRSPPSPDIFTSPSRSQEALCICENYHESPHSEVHPEAEQKVYPGDRIVAVPFLKPQRWDLVVFRVPDDPSVSYVKRLVGLPGETIRISDGAIWVNGEKQTSPAALAALKYHTQMEGWYGVVWGSEESPAVLKEKEYFVLGDFQSRARDSRIWEFATDEHSPYAVPEANLKGVVTHILWPPDRMRILR